MKNFLLLILSFGLIFILFFYQFSPCDSPIKYRIDTVDPQFDITKEEFANNIDKAQKIWGSAYGKNLFEYSPNGKLSINLVFDERQQLKNDIGQKENQIQIQENIIKPEIAEYENQVLNFKQKLADYNSKVEAWNAKGGAPPDIYNQLKQEQQILKAEADRLNLLAKQLNQTATNFNSQVSDLNQTVDTFNASLSMKPEEGVYDPKTNQIVVYFNVNQPELIHTLAHEFGHVLDMEHVPNLEAIMYSKTNQTLVPTKEDLFELQRVCQKKHLWWFAQKFVKVNILNK